MSIIKITAAELLPGDDVSGDVIATVDVQGAKTYLTYEDDDTRMRVSSAEVYTVERVDGVSTIQAAAPAPTERPNWMAAEAEAGARREHDMQLSFRRDRYRTFGR